MNSTPYKAKGKEIYEWINRNFPPLTWNIMAVKIGECFLDSGINPFNLNEEVVFDEKLVENINFFLGCYYDQKLPHSIIAH